MSNYTITLKQLIDGNFDFGLLSYPVFDEEYRLTLNSKILNHFKYFEIGYETPALFRDRLQERMSLIMPKYNALYSSIVTGFNPLYGKYEREDNSRKSTSSATNSSVGETYGTTSDDTNSKATNVHSDTPQGMLTRVEFDDMTWASDGAISDGTSHGSSTASNDNKMQGWADAKNSEEYVRTVLGYGGTVTGAEVLKLACENMVNIDLMVMQELKDLFMLLW